MVYMTQLFIHSSEPHQKGIIQFIRWIEKIKSTTKCMAPLKSKIYSSGYEWKVSLIPASFLPHCSLPQQQSFTNDDTNFRTLEERSPSSVTCRDSGRKMR